MYTIPDLGMPKKSFEDAAAAGGIKLTEDQLIHLDYECFRYVFGEHAKEERKSDRNERESIQKVLGQIASLITTLTLLPPRVADDLENDLYSTTEKLKYIRSELEYDLLIVPHRPNGEQPTGMKPFLRSIKRIFDKASAGSGRRSFTAFNAAIRQILRASFEATKSPPDLPQRAILTESGGLKTLQRMCKTLSDAE
jgi:hypothetical protein